MVDRSPFDRIVAAGGNISVPAGSAPDGNSIPVPKDDADRSMDAAACIGCGACVAACPNASASLFTGAKISHLGLLPQGQPERDSRALRMVRQMNAESFGQCTNIGECEAVCPKGISLEVINRMNGDFIRAAWKGADFGNVFYDFLHALCESRQSTEIELVRCIVLRVIVRITVRGRVRYLDRLVTLLPKDQ